MIYIKVLPNNKVILAGTVATKEMLQEGYFPYEGEIQRASNHIWEPNTKTVLPELTHDKKLKIDELKMKYEEEIQSDIQYMDTTFQADEKSQDTIAKVLSASGGTLPSGFFWLDALNNQVPMTYSNLQGLANTILLRGQQAFAKYQSLKAQNKSATDVETLESIVW